MMVVEQIMIDSLDTKNLYLATDTSDISLLWYLFILIFIIICFVLIFLIYIFSNKPDDWEHFSILEEESGTGKLGYIADSVKIMQPDYTDAAPLRNHIQMLFFEKMNTIHNLSINEIHDMKQKNPKKLAQLIKDPYITDFILNFEKYDIKQGFWDRFEKKQTYYKNKYLKDLNKVLDKMEAWGE